MVRKTYKYCILFACLVATSSCNVVSSEPTQVKSKQPNVLILMFDGFLSYVFLVGIVDQIKSAEAKPS